MESGATDSLRQRLEQTLSGAFRIEGELGGGGMSRVFLAEDQSLGRRVVVKVLPGDIAHATSAERFAREIRLSAGLQHPNIVPVLNAGTVDDAPYYTMPFIAGRSLRASLDALAKGERLPPAKALEILRDIARALAYAHDAGVVHRDIKPENVLLASDAAVVADFGVAKAIAAATRDGAAATTLTQGGVALGTPAYMSPEQAAADPSVDQRADVYAWGLIAYELLAGAHPFGDRRSVQALLTAHLVEHARPLADAAPNVSAELSALVMRCLAKNPADRPANGREIVDALSDATSGRVARGSSIPGKRRLLGLTVAILAASAAMVFYVARFRREVSPSAPAGKSTAVDAYLRGKVRVSSENRDDNDAAIAALREAIAADPSFAPAYAELARAYTIKVFYYAPDSAKKRLSEDAEVAVEKALALDPNLGEAYFARGLMLWTPSRRFPHEQTVQAYKQAIAKNPKLDEAYHQLALVYLHVGLLDEAQAAIDTALAINPSNTLARFRYGVIDLYRGDYAHAYTIFNSTPLDKNPSLWAFQTATALFRLGRESEASALIDKFLRDYPADEGGVGTSVRAMMLAKAGRRPEAEAAIAKAIATGQGFGHFHHTAYNIASAYALLGDNDHAMQYLRSAAENGFPCYPLFERDALLDGIRRDPQFISFMKQLRGEFEARKRQG